MRLSQPGRLSASLAGLAAFSLVAAAAPTSPAVGTATTAMEVVSLTTTGLGDLPRLVIGQAGTFASLDPSAAGNVLGAPWSSASVAPAVVGGEAQGAATARSDQAGDASTNSLDLGGLGLPLDGVVSPIQLTATATADRAEALVGELSADLAAVAGLVGIDISSVGGSSTVTRDAATAIQQVSVGGLSLSLGDLLPEDLLAALPIDVLLDLLAMLPVSVPDVQAVIDSLNQLVADVQAGVSGVASTSADVEDAVAAYGAAVSAFDAQQAIVSVLETDLAAAEAAAATAEASVTSLTADLADIASSTALDLVGVASACVGNLDIPGCLADLAATTQAALASAEAAAAAATAAVDAVAADLAEANDVLATLAAVVDATTDLVDSLIAALVALVDGLVGNLGDLLGELLSLDVALSDVIAGLTDVELLGLDEITVGVTSIATAAADTSSASAVCQITGLTIAGVELGGGDCLPGAVTGAIDTALGTLQGVLNALPVSVPVPLPIVDVLPTKSETVTSDAGIVTAYSQLNALRVELPSVDIDPGAVVDGLLAGLAEGLVADLTGQLPTTALLTDAGLGAAATVLDGALAQLPTLDDLQAQLGDVLALLPDGSALTALTTPGFVLDIDPSATASFTPAGAAEPVGPTAPTAPTLPATGGGAIVLAVAGLGGAFALRRRR